MCCLRFGIVFIYYVPKGTSVILNVPHAGLQQHKLRAKNIENRAIFDKKRKKTTKNQQKLVLSEVEGSTTFSPQIPIYHRSDPLK
jgi:hypothetical protein